MWLLWIAFEDWKGWLHNLGGFGLILLGLLDNSVVPLPGSMDALTIFLSASNRSWWPLYAVLATMGSLLGAYLTYKVASKGGRQTLQKKIGRERSEQVYRKFEKGGFLTVFIACLLPPPFPLVTVIMAAGALQYPERKFLGAVAAARGIRYLVVAYVGHRYGESIIGFFSQYERPVLYALIALAVLGAAAAVLYFAWYRPRRTHQARTQPATMR